MDRVILHCDCNGFFASVECIMNPKLKEVPMAVCGNPENRHGIILAKNELAKAYNIKTAETIWQAKNKCPDLVLVPPRHDLYEKYSRIVNEIYESFTDLVEPFGIDESWLDVTGSKLIFGDGKEIADKIRDTVRDETGLTVSVGVSFNKVFAKLGSDYKKPDATTVISHDNFKEIVFPLPVTDLLYVGKSAAESLRKIGINTIGQLAACDKRLVSMRLGKMGDMIWNYANGIDESLVRSTSSKREIKSVGNGITFRRNLSGLEDIKIGVITLADTVAWRMRKYNVKCKTIQVIIKDPNFKSISRQQSLVNPTFLSNEIAENAFEIIKANWNLKSPIRMLTITGMNLVPASSSGEQISIFGESKNENREKHEKIEIAMDNIRDKFGKNSISFGTIIKNDLGISEDESQS